MDYETFLREKYNKSALNPEELAEELSGVSVRMILERARECSGEVPPYIRIGRRMVFPIKEVAKFLETALVKVA